MGYLDRRRERMAKLVAQEVARLEQADVEKKSPFPPGSTMTDAKAIVTALAANSVPNSAYTQAQPLPRMEPMVPFGPGIPVPPSPLNPLRPEGRPFPRQFEFPVSWNLPGQGQRLLPFQVLRDFADRVDAARFCVEIRKGEIVALDWDIVLRPEAIEAIMEKAGVTNQAKAARMAREHFATDINRIKTFWERPDKLNGLIFPEWLTIMLEEHFVIDAFSCYPHLDMKGQLHSLEILDGSTIKPLLNARGGVPQSPEPAYQQILYGFPRGEFVVSSGVDGEFTSDQLIYKPRHRRAWTPYGQPPTEMALLTGDLYLKRQGWIRSEYSAGVLPELIIETDADLSPDQLRWYEEVFNEDLAGDTDQRHRARFLPRGFRPSPLASFAERYSPEYDEYLLTLIAAAYDVQPMELGIMPRGGLGGKGLGDSQENVTYRKSVRPTTAWIVSILNEISQQWLGMPRELTFSFQGLEAEDEHMIAKTRDIQIRTGGRTVNELRGEQGLPMYEFEEADMPFMLTQRGIIFLEGSAEAGLQVEVTGAIGPSPTNPKPPTPEINGSEPKSLPSGKKAPAADEAKTFINFAEKRIKAGKWRDFTFNDLTDDSARLLNLLGETGDIKAIKALVADITGEWDEPEETDLGKALPGTGRGGI